MVPMVRKNSKVLKKRGPRYPITGFWIDGKNDIKNNLLHKLLLNKFTTIISQL
jgi:hypothetical protein